VFSLVYGSKRHRGFLRCIRCHGVRIPEAIAETLAKLNLGIMSSAFAFFAVPAAGSEQDLAASAS